ncbi:MAG TPA: hypothetical protein V6D17_22940, partial [Candidatus Obscuribacterales bacterium]
ILDMLQTVNPLEDATAGDAMPTGCFWSEQLNVLMRFFAAASPAASGDIAERRLLDSLLAWKHVKQRPAMTRLILLICTLVAWSTVSCASVIAATGWIVEQKSKISGAHKVFLTAKALRVDSLSTGVTLICKAPAYRVQLFNRGNGRTFFTVPDKFTGPHASRVFAGHRDDMMNGPWKPDRDTTVAGVHASKLTMFKHPPSRLSANRFEVEHANGVCSASYSALTGVSLPRQFAEVLSRLYSLPPFLKLPLEVIYVDPSGAENLSLHTTRITKVTLSDDCFNAPPKLKLAASGDDVYVTETGHAGLVEALNWLGEVSGKPAKKK